MASPHQMILRSRAQYLPSAILSVRSFSTTEKLFANKHFKLAVIGGGSGGSAISNSFARELGKENVVVIEPQEMCILSRPIIINLSGPSWVVAQRNSKAPDGRWHILSSTWIKDQVAEFQPGQNSIRLGSGDTIKYDYLVIAMGIVHRYEKVKGLKEALDNHPEVCTNYDPKYVQKTFKALQNFKEGTALFTLNIPMKCPGAPAKIMYLADDYFRKGIRDKAKIIYMSSMGAMLGAPKYAKPLLEICKQRDMETHFFTKLAEVDPKSRVATFDVTDKAFKPTGEKKTVKYDFLHVGPPFGPPDALCKSEELVNEAGWLILDKHTLQSPKFPNVFGIGDCTNLPNAKTAAAVASESKVLKQNLRAFMQGKPLTGSYDGYSSCPLVTSYNTGVLAEFDYNWEALETLPIDQSKERRLFYYMKADLIPALYWHGLVKGYWEGPGTFRRLLHLGFSK